MTKNELPLKVFFLAAIGLMAPTIALASSGKESTMAQISQENTFVVNGIVTDNNGEPLPGVSVSIVGTKTGATTGIDGDFKINVKKNDRLRFSYVGYSTIELPASKEMKVELNEDNKLLSKL